MLRSLLEHQGAFLIASTGLGKTIIAAHVAAYLRMQAEIDSALVIGPAGLREVWRRVMRAARIPSIEFSYHTLRRTDGDSNLPILEHELGLVNEQTLIILDESHRLRNETDTEGSKRLSNTRIQEAVRERGAKTLLLTATPYGKDFSEVESQLRLLPAPTENFQTALGLAVETSLWQADELADLPDLPPCTVLTTPDVVRHFGHEDEQGERFVTFSEEDRRYFPRRIRLQTVRYTNPFDEFLADLLESKLLYKKVKFGDDPRQQVLSLESDNTLGERLALQEALYLHQFCSSPGEGKRVCSKLKSGDYNYEFARQDELSQFIHDRLSDVLRICQNPRQDPKLTALTSIIAEAGNDKIVVFCKYHETAHYIKNSLNLLLTLLNTETTVDAHNLDEIIRRFAPIANEVLSEERDPDNEIQVLIATRSMAEGFNLQDAAILVNYDLPWTVLQLAQRMGRILRPWHEPRDVTIYNFVPSTMAHERVRHARNWRDRLQERNQEHRSLAQIPVMVYEESRKEKWKQELEMEKLGREMYLAEDTHADFDLQHVMEFIQTIDDLTTSTFYNDLATIPDQEKIKSLPAGIRSAFVKPGRKRLFLLLRNRRTRLDTVLADSRGRPLEESWRRDEVMRVIRCFEETPKAPAAVYPTPDEFDAWIKKARQEWAKKQNLDPSQLQIVCALAIVPQKG